VFSVWEWFYESLLIMFLYAFILTSHRIVSELQCNTCALRCIYLHSVSHINHTYSSSILCWIPLTRNS